MEDYEKKYKEALKVIESLYNIVKYQSSSDALLTSQTLEKTFPELHEPEDERIRKGLIKGLSAMRDIHKHQTFSDDAINIDDAIAWLEKQGTPAKLSEEEQNRFAKGVRTSCAISFIDYLDTHKYEGKMCVSNGECEDIENAFHNAMWDRLHRYYCKYIEKQGEQKPSWSEYDKIQLSEAIQMIEANGTWIRSEDAVKKVSNWLKSLKPNHWKPSEQELAALRTAISVLKEERNFPLAAGHLQDILNHFESKEIRNDWKPSEEQMQALETAIICRAMPWEQLGTLYNDLKNL